MSLKDDVNVLRNIKLFEKIEPSKLKLLAFTSEHLQFMEGEFLCQQGEVGDAAYILLDGTADVIVNTPNGDVTVASLARNDIVGEIAILCDVPRTASVKATSNLATLRISKDSFFNLVNQFPQVGIEIMHELASRLHQTTQQLTATSSRLQALESEAGTSETS